MSLKNVSTSHLPCAACTKTPTDRAHIKSKGAGGSWDESNILPLCRICHTHQHKLGWSKFLERFPSVERTLHDKGWVLADIFGVVKLVRR